MSFSNTISYYLKKLLKVDVIFSQLSFLHLPEVMYINKITLPENYRRATFITLYRLFKDISFVAIDKKRNHVIGYILNKLDEGYSFFSPGRVLKKGHVFSVAVLPEYRRAGIGWALVTLGLNAMIVKENVGEVYLEVRESNSAAINLYKKFGMEVVGEVDKYYEDGEKAYVMAVPSKRCINLVRQAVDILRGKKLFYAR